MEGTVVSRLVFETRVCSRCGGDGTRIEYMHVENGRCFKCGRTGRVLTKRGAAASDAYTAAVTMPVKDLAPGQRISYTVTQSVVPLVIRRVSGTVERITLSRPSPSARLRATWVPMVQVETEKRDLELDLEGTVRRAVTREESQAILRGLAAKYKGIVQ